MKKVILILLTGFVFSCSKEIQTQKIGDRFFETFSERKEIDKMISFYAADFAYENIGFGSETNDPKFLYEQIYGWKDPAFKYDSKESITLTKLVSNDSTLVATGETLPYTYNGKEVEGTRFVIWLDLDKDSKIKKQTDWFDYPLAEIIEAFHLKNSMKIE